MLLPQIEDTNNYYRFKNVDNQYNQFKKKLNIKQLLQDNVQK